MVLNRTDRGREWLIDDLERLEPHQTGIYRIGGEITARYTVNAQGWNSGAGDYERERTNGIARVAVVGDSFVEALHVDAWASLAERLEERTGAEAHRFGISGAWTDGAESSC